jgi:SpoIID/LytB domain protein
MFSRAVAFTLIFTFTLIFLGTFPVSATDLPQTFTFMGSGYGHGVGMSQIGARAQALEGKSAAEILQYYYTGVTVEPIPDDQNMRVNIGHLLTSFALKTDTTMGQVEVFSGDIKEASDVAPIKILQTKDLLSFTLLGNLAFPSTTTLARGVEALSGGKSWTIRWSGTRYLAGSDALISLKIGATTVKYRYGQIQIKIVKAAALGYRIEVTNTLRLHDEYLWGISEVPSSWPLAAMQAQVIASRTYALNKAGAIKTACDCDIYGSSQDQTFVGYAKESEVKYGKLWKAAVTTTSADDSSGYVILYNSLPISAYYFSSSGGYTESAQNAWGAPIDYAQSVPDPWSLDTNANSKYAHWQRSITQAAMALVFSLPDVVDVRVVAKNSTGTSATVLATASTGKTSQLSGPIFRSRTKLPSTWFDLLGPQIAPAPTTPPSSTPLPTLSDRPERS